jgi:hypothetical protein
MVNYLLSADYSPAEDILVYASTTGYRAGGPGVDRVFDSSAASALPLTSPRFLRTTSFGLRRSRLRDRFKNELFDRHLT